MSVCVPVYVELVVLEPRGHLVFPRPCLMALCSGSLPLHLSCLCLLQDVLEGGNLRNALQELQQIIVTPIKAYSVLQATVAAAAATSTAKDGGRGEPLLPGAEPPLIHPSTDKGTEAKDPPAAESYPPPPAPTPTDGSEPAPAPVADGDIPSQFTRVMGKGKSNQSLAQRPETESQVTLGLRDQIQVRW
jgi:hypothetical protein